MSKQQRKRRKAKIKERREQWAKERVHQEPGNPIYQHIPPKAADLDKLRTANTLTDYEICRLSVESRTLYGKRRFCFFYSLGLVLICVYLSGVVENIFPFLPTYIITLFFVFAWCISCFYSFWFGLPSFFNSMLLSKYSSLYPQTKRKYTTENAYLVVCEECDAQDFGIVGYHHIIYYQNRAGEVKWAFIHKDNYEAMFNAKSNLPLIIVTVESMWPHKTDFAYIHSLYSFTNDSNLADKI